MQRIPGLVPGILFLLAVPYAHPASLAWDLYHEGNWPACSTEARRLLASDPTSQSAQFLLNASAARQSPGPESCSSLLTLASSASAPEIRAHAAMEAARALLHNHEPGRAWNPAVQAFLTAKDHEIFLQSLAILEHLHRRTRPDIAMPPDLERQYLTCAPLLRHVPDTLKPPRPDSFARRLGTAPGRLIVAFYRRCIRPAIGDRCSLSPSCSEYFHLSTRKHGLLGIPMLADRLVREPSVVAAARNPLAKGRRTVYHDPVEHHDFWLANP